MNFDSFVHCYRATVTFIDFEGRSDGESMKKLITQVKPRQLVRRISLYPSMITTTHSINPNLPDPVNFVLFGMMRYSIFTISFINIHENNLYMICI